MHLDILVTVMTNCLPLLPNYWPHPTSLRWLIYNRLLTINEEMGITMINTSISPIFAEVHDFSCAICDWADRIVAQIDGVPSHTASSMEAVKAVTGGKVEGA